MSRPRCCGRVDNCIRDAMPGSDYCRPCAEARLADAFPICAECGDESIFVWPSGRCAQCEEYAEINQERAVALAERVVPTSNQEDTP